MIEQIDVQAAYCSYLSLQHNSNRPGSVMARPSVCLPQMMMMHHQAWCAARMSSKTNASLESPSRQEAK